MLTGALTRKKLQSDYNDDNTDEISNKLDNYNMVSKTKFICVNDL
jgi:hypothetical protein